MFRRKLKILTLIFPLAVLLFAQPVFAQKKEVLTPEQNCERFYNWFTFKVEKPENKVGEDKIDPNTVQDLPRFCTAQELITWAIDRLLLFAGSVAVIFIIIGGFRYLTSAGNEEAAEKGKKTLVTSIIGLAVIVLAAAIVRIIASTLNTGNTGDKQPAVQETVNPVLLQVVQPEPVSSEIPNTPMPEPTASPRGVP